MRTLKILIVIAIVVMTASFWGFESYLDIPPEAYVFDERHYWLPFPREDTKLFVEFSKNPGW